MAEGQAAEEAGQAAALIEPSHEIMNTVPPPQPPPDVPAPPPGPEAERSRRWRDGLIALGILSVLFCVAWLARPVIIGSPRNAHRTEAISNLKQIGLALIEFDAEYGRFPDASTIADVQAKTSTTLALGSTSSNELFRQLISNGTNSERIFWAKTAQTPRKPNDVLGADALKKGECAFTYIAGLSSSDDPGTPVAMAPVIPGTWKFDPVPYKGFAVVLRLDGSVRTETIDAHGHVMIGGMNLFDPRQPHWNGKPPDIKWPE